MLPWRDGVIFYLLATFTFQHWSCVLASKAPPTWVKQPPTGEIFFLHDGTVTVDCVAEVLADNPTLNYSWLKNGQRLKWNATRMSMPQNSGTLTINPILSEDVGFYQCQANNTWGFASSNIVNIQETFLDEFPESEMTNIRVLKEDPLALYCAAPRSSPQATLHWQKQFENSPELHEIKDDDGRITLDSHGTLWFSHVTMDDASNEFTYVCTAHIPRQQTIKVGQRVSITVLKKDRRTRRLPTLQFVSPDVQTATQGSQVKLYCIFDGKPDPEVVWRKGNQHLMPENDDRLSLRSKGKILLINNVTTADEGNYTCIANNDAGKTEPHSVFLDVQVLPYFTVEPTSVTARQGEKVEIRCEAAGDPKPTITWTNNGKPAAALSGQKVLTLHRAKVADTANYGCNASNEIGHVYKDIAINVLDVNEDYYTRPLDHSTDYTTDSSTDSSTDIEHESTTERHMDTMNQDLAAVNVSSESVTVTWRANGPDAKYNVTVTCQQPASSCNKTLTNCPEPTRIFYIDGLNELTFPATPFTEYEVKVAETGPERDTAMLEPFTVRAHASVSNLPVTNLNQKLVPQESSIDLMLTWEKPCSQSAPLSHYEVKLKESRGTTEDRVFRSTYLHQRIINLKPGTNYMATVSPVYIVASLQNPGLPSTIGFTTPEAAPLRGKCALEVERKSTTTAMVTIKQCVVLDISDIKRWTLLVSRHRMTPTSGAGSPPEILQEFQETYVASPENWNPFVPGEETTYYTLGTNKTGCKEKIWCNNVLQSDSDYYVMLRVVTSRGFMDSQVTHFRTVASSSSDMIVIIVLIIGSIILCIVIFHFYRRYDKHRHHGVAKITQVAHFKTSDPEKQVYIAINKPQDDDVMEKPAKVERVSPEFKVQEDKEKLQSIDLGVIDIEPKEESPCQTEGIDNHSFLKSDDDDVFESQKLTHPENGDQAKIPENNDDKSLLNDDDDFQGPMVTEGPTKRSDDQSFMNQKGDDDFQGQKVTEGQTKDVDDQPFTNQNGDDDFQGQNFSPPIVDNDNQIFVTEDADMENVKDQESLVDDVQQENSPELSIQLSENSGEILETAFE